MAEKGKNCSLWLNFFRDAGICGGFETKYALVFDENRIKMNMLMDINKECLRDMGIKAMGDIIAILKHAKVVHEESKEQEFESSKPIQPGNARREEEAPRISSLPSKPSVEAPSTSVPKVTTTSDNVPLRKTVTEREIPKSNSAQNSAVPKPKEIKKTVLANPTKKVSSSLSSTSRVASTSSSAGGPVKRLVLIRSSDSARCQEEVPVQKKTRVLPEHEGKYEIRMSQGTIARRAKILESRLGPTATRTTGSSDRKADIFNRLGESKVTSTSTIDSSVPKRTSPTRSSIPSATRNKRPLASSDDDDLEFVSFKRSVFSRLGGQTTTSSTGGTSSSSTSASSSRPLSRTISGLNSAPVDRLNEDLPIRQRVNLMGIGSRTASSTSGDSGRVYRNPTPRAPTPPPPPKVLVGSKLRSIAPSSGKPTCIKARLDGRKKRITYDDTKKGTSQQQVFQGRAKVISQPQKLGGSAVVLSKPSASVVTTPLRRVVTRKVQSSGFRSDFLDLPELDDPMAAYYDDLD